MIRISILPLLVLLASPCAVLRAGAPCCDGCGCQPCTRKVCRLVCEPKEETKKVYSCKCEDFCIPGRSICCKKPCDCHWWCCLCCDHYTYKPTCGCVRTRVVPVITTETKKVPSYKCVVEEVCTRCGHCARKVDYPSAEDAATAVAMVKDPGVERIEGAEMPPAADPFQPPVGAAPSQEVASRSFVDRFFVRK